LLRVARGKRSGRRTIWVRGASRAGPVLAGGSFKRGRVPGCPMDEPHPELQRMLAEEEELGVPSVTALTVAASCSSIP